MKLRLVCLVITFLLGLFLFDLWLVGLLMAPLGLFFAGRIEKHLQESTEKKYLAQYLDFLTVFSMTTSVGRGGLDAFQYCLDELSMIHPLDEGFMKDLQDVISRTNMDQDIYQIFRDHTFAIAREEIDVFVQMLYLASKKGGDMDRVIAYCSSLLEERVRMQRDKEVLLARQKFELDVIIALPFVLLAIMKSSNQDYLTTLISNPMGWVALIVSALLMAFSLFLGVQLCSFKSHV
ncbi:type II secretion system F family protein [Clostridia bacterium]|nr:type II secretion system F family protein [Clostridia bacterium]